MLCFSIILVPVVLDSIIWIVAIVNCAGNLLVGGLYEAHLDYRVLEYIKKLGHVTNKDQLELKTELLVAVACGNLDLASGDPQTRITRSITAPATESPPHGLEKTKARLLSLQGAQSCFGEAVGSPVLFFLGAFVYTILDLRSDPSNENAAFALDFGMGWMIMVNIAIVSGCLLAANNPSTAAGVVGCDYEALQAKSNSHHRVPSTDSRLRCDNRMSSSETRDWKDIKHLLLGWSNAYETEFQPVGLWARGRCKMKCK